LYQRLAVPVSGELAKQKRRRTDENRAYEPTVVYARNEGRL
jgi:hypothetical protein